MWLVEVAKPETIMLVGVLFGTVIGAAMTPLITQSTANANQISSSRVRVPGDSPNASVGHRIPPKTRNPFHDA